MEPETPPPPHPTSTSDPQAFSPSSPAHAGARRCSRCGSTIADSAAEGWCTRCLLESAAVATEGAGSGSGRGAEAPPLSEVQKAFPLLADLELIGVGGMGAVYKGRQPALERWVALKVLRVAHGSDPAFAERFLREARVLARLSHPNIVAVHDFGQNGEFCYLLMEYVDGVNLRQAMRAGRFRPDQALALVPQICAALQFAHESGVMHRDVKPENILLDGRGRVKLVDFGIAKLLVGESRDPALTLTGFRVGTPQYMAPEQVERPADVDHRADIYSLGVVFYELLTGELPLGRFAAPSTKTPLDARVDEIVMRALAKERELRQQSANEVRTAVEAVGTQWKARSSVASEPISAVQGGAPGDPGVVAPLWEQSRRYQVWVLVLLWVGVVTGALLAGPSLRFMVTHLAIDPFGGNYRVAGMLIGLALCVAAIVKVMIQTPVWLGPLRVPTEAAHAEDRLNRAVWLAVVAALGMLGFHLVFTTVLATGPVAQALGRAIAQSGGFLPRTIYLSILIAAAYPLLLVAGWRRGMREARRPLPSGNGPMPAVGLRLALALLVLATCSSLLTAWQQRLQDGQDQMLVTASWGAFLPVTLAWWSRSRFWRSVAVLLSGYGVAMGMGYLSVLVLGRSLGSDAMDPAVTPIAALVAVSGMVLIHGLVWYSLRRADVQRAFGYGHGNFSDSRRESSAHAARSTEHVSKGPAGA